MPLNSEYGDLDVFNVISIDLWQHCNKSHFAFISQHTDIARDLYPTYIKSNNEQVGTSAHAESR
jgi:hypothetical protein